MLVQLYLITDLINMIIQFCSTDLDLNYGSFLTDNSQATIDCRQLKEKDINRANSNNFATLMR